jgi:hypothetical protein
MLALRGYLVIAGGLVILRMVELAGVHLSRRPSGSLAPSCCEEGALRRHAETLALASAGSNLDVGSSSLCQ